MKHYTYALLCVSLAGIIAGCSKDTGPTGPALVKVSGKVNLDSKPMEGGEIRFNAVGQPVKSIEIMQGAFSGEAFVGKNRIDVVWEKDGPRHPMNPKEFIKVNTVSAKFSGPNSVLNQEIGAGGASDLKFDVTKK